MTKTQLSLTNRATHLNPYYNYNTRSNMQHARLQVTTKPYYIYQTRAQQTCKTCTSLADLIIIIYYKHNIMHELATCSQSHSSVQVRDDVTPLRHVTSS